jgi:polar amino acid transport system substrate-binding protein
MRWLLLLGALLASPVMGQALPYHIDPSAREVLPNLAAVPAIRFLTTADFPPFNYRDASGELVGFNVDLARAICTRLKVACTIQAWPWEQASRALADRQGDALIAGLAITPQNGELFDFTNIYHALPGRFVTTVEEARAFDPSRLANTTIAVRDGSAHEQFVARYIPEAKAEPFATEIAALEAVRDGRVSAYFGDGLRAAFWLNEAGDCCRFAGEPYFNSALFGQGLAIALPAGHDAVRLAIDHALILLKKDGGMDELYLRWFPIGFY